MPTAPQAPEGAEAPVEGAAPATPDTPTTPPPDFTRITERMDEMSSQQQALAEQFGQWFEQQQQPEEEPPYYEMDEETGELTPEGVRAVYDEHGRQITDERFDQRMAEWQAEQSRQQAVRERDEDWELLREEIPDLAKQEVAQPLIRAAAELVAPFGEEATNSPGFVRLIELLYKEAKYDESAAAQTPAGPGVVLESAQGAAQPTKGSETDWGDRIVKAAERLRPQL